MNLCTEMNCSYWSEGVKRDGTTYGFGCQYNAFATSCNCPVSYIKGTTANQYAVYADDDCAAIILDCARGVCPDPVVRLQALSNWPIESMESVRSKDLMTDNDHADRISAAYDDVVFGTDEIESYSNS
jgi:hypothetical protein